jgi:hypothetical protein
MEHPIQKSALCLWWCSFRRYPARRCCSIWAIIRSRPADPRLTCCPPVVNYPRRCRRVRWKAVSPLRGKCWAGFNAYSLRNFSEILKVGLATRRHASHSGRPKRVSGQIYDLGPTRSKLVRLIDFCASLLVIPSIQRYRRAHSELGRRGSLDRCTAARHPRSAGTRTPPGSSSRC